MWYFIQNEILGMRWLEGLLGGWLDALGVDTGGRMGGSLLFFLYDVIKIMPLLCLLIFIISYIQSHFPSERSRRILGRFNGLLARIIAALLGTVTPFCSCSSIPLFIGFTRAGLPLGVTFSFLISSPMVDLGSLVLLTSVFGWRVAVSYVVLGLVVAVAGGALIGRLRLDDQVEEYVRADAIQENGLSSMAFRQRCAYSREQVILTAEKVYPYVICGVAIGAFIHNWIPEGIVSRALGETNPLGVSIATIVGVPMYADIFGTIPIAEALLAKGARLGVVLAFMMAVTTLSLPSMVMLRRAVKPKLLWLFIGICTIGILLVGHLFNLAQVFLLTP